MVLSMQGSAVVPSSGFIHSISRQRTSPSNDRQASLLRQFRDQIRTPPYKQELRSSRDNKISDTAVDILSCNLETGSLNKNSKTCDNEDRWSRKMFEYLQSEQDSILTDKRLIVVTGSSSKAYDIASSLISQFGSNAATAICIVVSLSDEKSLDASTHHEQMKKMKEENMEWSRNNVCSVQIMESVEMEDIESGGDDDEDDGSVNAMDVIVLATSSPAVINEDSFINDYLRRTDTPIHMSTEFTSEFLYWSRNQEGANITLW